MTSDSMNIVAPPFTEGALVEPDVKAILDQRSDDWRLGNACAVRYFVKADDVAVLVHESILNEAHVIAPSARAPDLPYAGAYDWHSTSVSRPTR